jgi:cytoskeletal protein CcmA (bactofilin family)
MKYGENLFGRRDPRTLHESAAPAIPHAASPHVGAPVRPASAVASDQKPAEPAATADEAGSRLIVGPNIKLKGVEIDDCDTLVVEGRVEATMVSRIIQIAQNGAFNGKVDVEVAEVHGHFQGEMTARKKLVVHSGGRVSGKIRYGRMQVHEGGQMSGDIGAIADAPAVAVAR